MNKKLIDIAKGWYAIANSRQRAEGKCWCPNARAFCQEIADEHNLSVERVAGIVAALSPAAYWDLNKRQAEALIQAHADGGVKMAREVVLSTYRRQAEKAYEILRLSEKNKHRIPAILGPKAWKTRAFYRSIMGSSVVACVDRHMVSALNFTDRWNSSRWCYDLLQSVLVQAAHDLSIEVSELQATIWITFKEMADANSRVEQGVQHPVRTQGKDAMDCPV